MKTAETMIWLDTDIGDDVDDALTLALALSLPDVRLVGISTVYHKAALRARLAEKIVQLYAKDVPVYAGCDRPLGKSAGETPFTQFEEDIMLPRYAPKNENEEQAVDALIAAAKKYGNALHIVAIGPYTNIARALQKDPAAMRKARYTVMGGAFTEAYREWNIICDLKASEILFRSGCDITCVGFDCTKYSVIPADLHARIDAAETNERQGYVRHLINMWEKATGGVAMLHDAYALYSLCRPKLYQMKTETVYLETQGEISSGMMFLTSNINTYAPYPAELGRRLTYCEKMEYRKATEEILETIFDIK